MNAIVLNGAPPGSLEYSMESASIKSAYLFHTNVVSAGISYMNIFYEDIFMEKKDDLDFMLRYLDAEPAFTKYFKSAAEVRKTMRSIKNNGRKGKQAIVAYNRMLRSVKEIYHLTVQDRLISLQRNGFPQMKDLSEDLHVLQCEPDDPDSKGNNQLMKNLMLLNSPQHPVIDGGFCHVLYDKAINLLSKLPENRTVALTKLEKHKEKELSIYQDEETKLFPSWFTFGARSKRELEDFLRTNELIKRFGTYQPDKKEFETHGIQDREVVLDGSNVAHNSHVDHKTPPTVQNMVLMVRYLKDKGFTNIKVISDASLKHKLDDPERLDEIKEMVVYEESPARTSADIHIIQYVKKNHCLLVSNDKFKEWKAIDPWIGDNVDYYRLSFKIENDKVSLTEFDS